MEFGINTNLLETNVINLAVVIGCLVYFGGDILKQTLNSRKQLLAESLETAQRQADDTKQKLALLEEKKQANQEELTSVIKPRLSRLFEENKKTLVAKHTNEMQRLILTQENTLRMEKERVMNALSQKVKKRSIDEGIKKINKTLTTNKNLVSCIVNESIPLILKS